MYHSIVQERNVVPFPAFTGERAYMIPFLKKEGLPEQYARWQPTIDAMLEGINTEQEIFMMIDQKIVQAGDSHRRPGVHIDGYWNKDLHSHKVPGHTGSRTTKGWEEVDFSALEALVLASDVVGCRAFSGEWSGVVGEGGDCSGVDISNLKEHVLSARRVYAGNASMLHESVPIVYNTPRTLVRLNVPGWSVQ